ncbi:MAG TPA: LuxR C-terminal-related transcriptional regulator [Gemmatimonadales bacterium]|nr:LuxR C-terminal-related transcriptional regulator [Gemmatimonadales bacterium]
MAAASKRLNGASRKELPSTSRHRSGRGAGEVHPLGDEEGGWDKSGRQGQDHHCRAATGRATLLRRLGAERAAGQGEALLRELEQREPPRPGPGALTRRQLEILRLVAQGASNAEIARRLSLSEHTVKRDAASLLTRLGLKTRAAAAAQAAKLGLL